MFSSVTQSAPSLHEGLSEREAQLRIARYGANELPTSRPRNLMRLLGDVLLEPMLLLLVGCGSIYLLLGSRNEALMLLGFVFVVMGISFVQQRRTERSLQALRDLSSPRALVWRDGQARRVAGRELVCGDIVLLAEGDRVPADIDLIEAAGLMVDESMLTGESGAVLKQAAAALPGSADKEKVFAGTLVTQGKARGVVIATGARSALGRIGRSLAGIKDESTPIQRETARVVRRVAVVGLALASALALAYWFTLGDWLHGLLAGLTLAMGILPEELPVVLTIFMGLGAWRLARDKVLARSIPAVELLGATTVLCVDKTGTLTTNRMALRRLCFDSNSYDSVDDAGAPLDEALHELLEFAVLSSHRQAFDPMETAIAQAGQRLLADTEHLHADWTLVDDYALSPDMLAMSRVWQSSDRSELLIAAKGAPEAIVDLCHLGPCQLDAISAQVKTMADDGLRVLGVARALFDADELPAKQHDFDFEFLGLIALEDPLRSDVPKAIAECQAAGIRVVMMTGDHPATAMAIARQAGLSLGGKPMTGMELAELGDAKLQKRLAQTQIFCRVQPEHKLRLVQAFRASGEVVAMTGDGVNDAPALKAAHIGVAMGARGSDVAREAAALVLLNDDFASLVTAVRYGRRVFANLRKAIVFVIAVHIPIVGLSIAPVLMGWPMLLMPVHILFLQLIIDPACSVVFEAEAMEQDVMRARPRRPDMRLFDAEVVARGLWQGLGLMLLLLALYAGVHFASDSDDLARATTFATLVLANLGLIHSNRSWRSTSWRGPAEANRFFAWIALATLALLSCVLAVAPISRLFAFARPTPIMLLAGSAALLLSLLWFEAVKRMRGRP
jgi:Ca2+-transporting ATPase